MPVVFLERLPLPNLKTYTCVSVVALSACVYFATQVIRDDPNWDVAAELGKSLLNAETPDGLNRTNASDIERRSTVINMAFCWLILMGRCVQKLVFGELRVSEQQHLKDKFWNFIFYKFIFIFGIVNVQYVDEVLLWCSWFAMLGFLQLLSQLANDRFEYLSFSPTTPIWSHAKLLGLLACIFTLSGFMLLVSIFVGFYGGFNTFAFMSAEVILLSIRSLHVIIRYAIHLYEIRYDDDTESNNPLDNTPSPNFNSNSSTPTTNSSTTNSSSSTPTSNSSTSTDSNTPETASSSSNFSSTNPSSSSNFTANTPSSSSSSSGWHKRGGPIPYYIELVFELTALCIDFVHHMHMLVWSNILLSMASLVVCMQLRYLMHEIQRKVKRHRNYLWVRNHLEQNYPMASNTEISDNSDNCAICWERILSARRLPCGHLFHTGCLQSWLEQDTSCPTCRLVLSVPGGPSSAASAAAMATMDTAGGGNDVGVAGGGVVGEGGGGGLVNRGVNHFFHFDGSRYVSWLPSFSVEVSHATHVVRPDVVMAALTSQLEEMARQVQQLFPHMPLSTIVDDLRVTHSIEVTIENVLDGRLVAPQIFREPEVHSPPVTTTMPTVSVISNSSNGSMSSWDDIDTEDSANLGSRFSKSSSERERILYKRKELLIHSARRRYLEKQNTNSSAETQS